ncbi:MAG: DUF1559 domain-containing protein [Planctomycetota bacterium]
MPIPFRCPQCGHETIVDEKYAGQSGPCAKCGTMITVPAGAPVGGPPTGFPQQQYPVGAPAPSSSGSWTTVLVILGVLGAGGLLVLLVLAALLFPAISQARQAARRTQSMGNLKQISLAVHNYADTYRLLPYAGAEDREYGLAMSSRVRLLPFIESFAIHDRVNYNEPWDSPANQWLSTVMPRNYASPMQPPSVSNTTYLAVVDSFKVPADAATWDRNRPQPVFSQDARTVQFSDITDGSSNTLMFLEVDASDSVIWSSPRNWIFDSQQPRKGLGATYGNGFLGAFVDGSVRFIDNSTPDETLSCFMTRNDGKAVFAP